MENPTQPPTRFLILTPKAKEPVKPAVTEADLNVAYFGGLLMGGVLIGFTVAGIMSVNHDREMCELQSANADLKSELRATNRRAEEAIRKADRLIAEREAQRRANGAVPIRPRV